MRKKARSGRENTKEWFRGRGAARKRYAEAAEMLLAALTAPSMVTNAIVVAAWKKWALLGLLREGAVPQLPKWTSPAVSRTAKQEGGAYQVGGTPTRAAVQSSYL